MLGLSNPRHRQGFFIFIDFYAFANWQTLADYVGFSLQFCFIVQPLNLSTMNIDRMEFLSWMDRIMERFDILMQHTDDIHKQRSAIDGEELLDNQDLLQMLKISSRSLQRYRSGGKLPYYTISGKIYYKLSDVHQFIRDGFTSRSTSIKDK
jgi:hypothetical protein